MFQRDELRTKPSKDDYPRIGPTMTTKWFQPSISPGPIHSSWTTSQPCCIDAGGNIFFVNGIEDVTGSEHHRPWTTTGTVKTAGAIELSSSGSEPSRPKSSCRYTSHSCAGHQDGKRRFHHGPDNNNSHGRRNNGKEGERREILHHAGGILRCRSATVGLIRGPQSAKGGTTNDTIDRATVSPVAPGRPTLRAYSAPLFLHCASFPPKRGPSHNDGGVIGRKMATASTWRDNGRAWGGGSASRSISGTGAVAAAPCQHRPRGYLHRFMGFEQEKISSPPVTTIAVLGGLGEREFPRAIEICATTTTRTTEGIASETGRRNPAGEETHRTGCEEEPIKRTRTVLSKPETLGNRVNTHGARFYCQEGGTRRSVATSPVSGEVITLHENAFPLGLFADGSSLAPISPPEVRQQVPPVWCRGSKMRPMGAKRQKPWKTELMKKPPKKTDVRTPATGDGCVGSIRRGGGVIRVVGKKGREKDSHCCSAAFLPYSLERPVSPERTGTFSYTCN